MSSLEFFVPGRPQPGGSKRGFPVRAGGALTGRVALTDANPTVKHWGACVVATAFAVAGERDDLPFAGPLALRVEFILARPRSHYGSGRNAGELRSSAPEFPATRPDLTKLLRPLEDALNSLAWRDDAQVVTQVASKRWGVREGAYVVVKTINPQGDA